jgi:CRP/FNR family transcriptional regulator, nitrogen oxide reductase regulator
MGACFEQCFTTLKHAFCFEVAEIYLQPQFIQTQRSNTMEKVLSSVDSLRKIDMFKGLTEEQYDRAIHRGIKKQLPPNDFLFRQGSPASRCYLVMQGQLKLTKLNEHGKEVIIRYVGVGEVTAAVAVLRNGVYPVTAESVGATEVIGWDHPTMINMMRQFPDIAINFLGVVLTRIEDVQQRYLEICTEQVDRRIAHSLLRLMRWKGVKKDDGILIEIPLSRQNIADYSGTTLYTVSRTLSGWEKKNWIKSGREKIIVTDPHALVAFAEAG